MSSRSIRIAQGFGGVPTSPVTLKDITPKAEDGTPVQVRDYGVVCAGPMRRYVNGMVQSQLASVMGLPLNDIEPVEAIDTRRMADTAFIAEAFNVAHETGLMPRELAAKLASMDALLSDLIVAWEANEIGQIDGALIERARALKGT